MKLTRRSVLAGAVASVASPALVKAAEPLNVSVVPANAIHWAQFVAAEKGFYKEQGFEAKILPLQSSAQSLQAALAGDFQIATSQPETWISAFAQGATELVAMAAPSNNCDWVLVGSHEVTKLADLKGKGVGLSGLRSSEEWLTGRLLLKNGMKPGDVTYVLAGTSAAKAAALDRNGLAGAVLFEPSAEFAIRNGLPALAKFSEIRAYPTIVYVVKKSWAETGAGPRASSALQKAHGWLWNPENKAEAIAILSKFTKRDADILAPVYESYFVSSKSYSKTGAVEIAGLDAVLADITADNPKLFPRRLTADEVLLDPKWGGLRAS